MRILKVIFSKLSTPLVLIGLLLVLLFGLALLIGILSLVMTHTYVVINIFVVLGLVFVVMQYRKLRRPLIGLDKFTQESKLIYSAGAVIGIISSLNYWYGIVRAPIIFVLYGAYCAVTLYLVSDWERTALREKLNRTDNIKSQTQSFPRPLLNSLILVLAISGYWFYQIEKNERILIQDGYQIAADLVNLQYCETSVSWCTAVDKVNRIEFIKTKSTDSPGKTLEMCASLSYKYSRDGRNFQSDWREEEVCFGTSGRGAYWYANGITSEVYDLLEEKLKS
jgi:hypothetical protein